MMTSLSTSTMKLQLASLVILIASAYAALLFSPMTNAPRPIPMTSKPYPSNPTLLVTPHRENIARIRSVSEPSRNQLRYSKPATSLFEQVYLQQSALGGLDRHQKVMFPFESSQDINLGIHREWLKSLSYDHLQWSRSQLEVFKLSPAQFAEKVEKIAQENLYNPLYRQTLKHVSDSDQGKFLAIIDRPQGRNVINAIQFASQSHIPQLKNWAVRTFDDILTEFKTI